MIERRNFLALTGAAILGWRLPSAHGQPLEQRTSMYGLIGKMTATPGQRDALAAILLSGTEAMPGCLSYVIASDPAEPDALWVTEVWESAEHHRASLNLPGVQEAIARGRPLIASFGQRTETVPLGGHGLSRSSGS